jgi:hypothetical protein
MSGPVRKRTPERPVWKMISRTVRERVIVPRKALPA